MKKYVMTLCVVSAMMFGTLALADDCIETAALQASWKMINPKVELFQDDAATTQTLDALKAGEMSLDDLASEEQGGAAGMVEFLEGGEVSANFTLADPSDPMVVNMKVKGEWTVDCATLSVQMASLESVEINMKDGSELPDEQKAAMEEGFKNMAADPEFTTVNEEDVIYIAEDSIITQTEAGKISIYQKQ